MSDPDHGDPHSSERDPNRPQGPTVRDRRRIDPDTYEVRETQETAAPGPGAVSPEATGGPEVPTEAEEVTGLVSEPLADVSGEPDATEEPDSPRVAELEQALAERTLDLQRIQAEYVNYKRRVDRDRETSRAAGSESVLKDLLAVVDDLRSAREHEQLTGGFRAVAEEIEKITAKYGLVAFGEAGDPFDPQVHEALMHSYSEDVTGPTCVQVLQPGYRLNDKVLRPARVAVAEPSSPQAGA